MLTDRECEVLLLLAEGCSYGQIASRLGISVHTVSTHLKNCYRKLGVRRATDAVTRVAELMPERLAKLKQEMP